MVPPMSPIAGSGCTPEVYVTAALAAFGDADAAGCVTCAIAFDAPGSGGSEVCPPPPILPEQAANAAQKPRAIKSTGRVFTENRLRARRI